MPLTDFDIEPCFLNEIKIKKNFYIHKLDMNLIISLIDSDGTRT